MHRRKSGNLCRAEENVWRDDNEIYRERERVWGMELFGFPSDIWVTCGECMSVYFFCAWEKCNRVLYIRIYINAKFFFLLHFLYPSAKEENSSFIRKLENFPNRKRAAGTGPNEATLSSGAQYENEIAVQRRRRRRIQSQAVCLSLTSNSSSVGAPRLFISVWRFDSIRRPRNSRVSRLLSL